MQKPESTLVNETHKILGGVEIQTNHQISARRPNFVLINKEEITCQVDFVFPVSHKVKIKETDKINRYGDLAREQKKLWNIRMMVIPIVAGAFGKVSKDLE